MTKLNYTIRPTHAAIITKKNLYAPYIFRH